MAKYEVVEELGEGSSVGAHAVGDVIEIEDADAAAALVSSGHIKEVAE